MTGLSSPNTELQRQLWSLYQGSLPHYSAGMLKVPQRGGGERTPFILKPAQMWVHQNAQEQLKERGFVRSLLPKARQLGMSAYTAGRFFHATTNNFGVNTYILTHKSEATANLFNFVKGFYGDVQAKRDLGLIDMCPELGASNAKELFFDKLGGRYRVGTAEGSGQGVGTTNHRLHLSEMALYHDPKDVSTGLLNTVEMRNWNRTEIFAESTGRGPVGLFYNMVQQAVKEANKGLWRVNFLPWIWDRDYRMEVPTNWYPPEEFLDYSRQYKLDKDQTYWFWVKNQQIAVMNGSSTDLIHQITRQEYPMTLDECFLSAAEYAFFRPEFTIPARFRQAQPQMGLPKILGWDIGIDGNDKSFVADRQGTALGSRIWQSINHADPAVQCDRVASLVHTFGIDVVIIDASGPGIGFVPLLKMKVPSNVTIIACVFGSGALQPKSYINRKAELYDYFRQWLSAEHPYQPSIPNDEQFAAQMAVMRWGEGQCYRNNEGRLQVTPKEKVREELNGHSPDELEAAALTCAFPDALLARYVKIG